MPEPCRAKAGPEEGTAVCTAGRSAYYAADGSETATAGSLPTAAAVSCRAATESSEAVATLSGSQRRAGAAGAMRTTFTLGPATGETGAGVAVADLAHGGRATAITAAIGREAPSKGSG